MTKDRSTDRTGKSPGRVDFDDRGNAIWRPDTEVRTQSTLIRILNIGGLSIAEEDHKEDDKKKLHPRYVKPAKPEQGYNPYDSGPVRRDGDRPRKKDLRALSNWIETKKRLESDK